jgi:AbrB family looped-hinge helix DNA binding protein
LKGDSLYHHGVKIVIDSRGRLAIPKAIREAAGIGPGAEVDVVLVGELIEVRPLPAKVRLGRVGRLLVAAPEAQTGTLSAGAVEQATEAVRER